MLAAGDAGSTAVLAPVAAELRARGLAVEAFASGPALAQWRKVDAGGVHEREEPVRVEEAGAALGDAAVLLSGAGVFNTIEHTFRRAAQARGVPSVSMVDFWGRVDERFRRGDEVARPDVACVLDDAHRRELLDAGFAGSQVIVTGSPHLEGVARFLAEYGAARAETRRALGLDPSERVVLFVSEPFDAADRDLFGYDQASTLQAVLRAADEAAGDRRVRVVARPHPRETGTALADVAAAWRSPRVSVQVSADGDARAWVVAADIVAGMTSVVLIEAALARRPAFSVQIGLRRPDPNLANALGLTRLVLDAPALARAFHEAFAGTAPMPDAARLQQIAGLGCAARVADQVAGFTHSSSAT